VSGERRHTDYSSYLLIDDLLQLQRPLTPGADDEMLFIVVHQSYELWFKLILHELDGTRAELTAGRPWSATPRLRRAVAAERLLLEHLDVLETMSPDGFFAFRDPLAPASGFESVQFREIELLSGGIAPSEGAVAAAQGGGRDRLSARASEPTLWDAVIACLGKLDLVEVAATDGRTTGEHDAVLATVVSIYRQHDDPVRAAVHELFESLVDHDEAVALWRHRHMLVAAREIGGRPGTGGSLGVEYLSRTLPKRFFPVLWEARSLL